MDATSAGEAKRGCRATAHDDSPPFLHGAQSGGGGTAPGTKSAPGTRVMPGEDWGSLRGEGAGCPV